MAQTLLTPTAVTREALRILHQKLNFIGTINRQYDDSFAKSGAKIGDSLKIRLPNEYTVRTGATLDTQDIAETSVTLQIATQKGVDVNFTSDELTLDLDDFSSRILEPAMAVLAANIESDALSMVYQVPNRVSDYGATVTLNDILTANKYLLHNLAPYNDRCLLLHPDHTVHLVDAVKGLFNDPGRISKNYREGRMANNFMGFSDVLESSLMPTHTGGTDDGTGDYLVNDTGTIAEGATSITVDTGAGTWTVGDIFTFDSVNAVHPETKADLGYEKPFTVTAAAAASATTINFSPALYSTGGKQNVDAMPANDVKLNKQENDESTAVGASAVGETSIAYHKDAFAFATADLVMPSGVDFAAREVYDGVSMRIVRDYDINNDKFPCRIDVLYGHKAIRPQIACRIIT